MQAKIVQMVEGRFVVSTVEVENIIPAMEVRGARVVGVQKQNPPHRIQLRETLVGHPVFSSFSGPMHDEINGEPAIRYESSEANERLSA